MGLFDFDFSAVERMFNSMSEEEKHKVMDAASSMMNKMDAGAMKEQAQEIREEEEDEPTGVEVYLGMDDELLEKMDGHTMEMLEAAADLEQYYEDIEDADLSASALFYSKAVLSLLRLHIAPRLVIAGQHRFSKPELTSLYDYRMALGNEEAADTLGDLCGDASKIEKIASGISTVMTYLQRAEFDSIGKADIEMFKMLLLQDGLLDALAM